jgi:hypothetical protein
MATSNRLQRCSTVSRRQLDFESDDLIPYCIGAVAIRNGEEFPQPAMWVLGLGFEGRCLVLLHFNEWRFDWLFWSGLFFVHDGIIPQTPLVGHTKPIPTDALRP